jgi:hypothetical protein
MQGPVSRKRKLNDNEEGKKPIKVSKERKMGTFNLEESAINSEKV